MLCDSRRRLSSAAAAPTMNSIACTTSLGCHPGKFLQRPHAVAECKRAVTLLQLQLVPCQPLLHVRAHCPSSQNCNILSMYRHPLPNSFPWNSTCRLTAPPPAAAAVPPGTFSDYSCIGPSPFLSPSTTSKNGLNRQRICMLRNVCVVDVDTSPPDNNFEANHISPEYTKVPSFITVLQYVIINTGSPLPSC